MCGIIIVLCAGEIKFKNNLIKLSRLIRHRGPDYSGMVIKDNIAMVHERLVIVDPRSGDQPFKGDDGDLLGVNGEIYNHMSLRKKYPFAYKTASDCEVIMALDLPQQVHELDGIYGFGLWKNKERTLFIARDSIGVIPLYYGYRNNELWVASELKVLEEAGVKYDIFPPNTLACAKIQNDEVNFNMRQIVDYIPKMLNICSFDETCRLIRRGLKMAVHKQLMTDVPFGCLLSGGLDSSLITSIAVRYAQHRIEDEDKTLAHWPRIHTFSIGLVDSPDLVYAKKVAEFLGTVHHEWNFTVEDGINALRDVIWYTETYDVTTIRASTPMYLLAKRIKSMGIKMILSGEGSDELFGGYLYFHKAPSPEEFHEETLRKVQNLHLYDCLRANKAPAAAGLETRPPFLDLNYVKSILSIDTKFKMITENQPIEKWILRKAFENRKYKYLPDEILWRTKIQLSDGIGYSWIDSLKIYTDEQITDEQFALAAERFPLYTPKTKEAYYYRSIFEEYYPNGIHTVPYCDSVACSTPTALEWDPQFKINPDPSGRSVSYHPNAFCI